MPISNRPVIAASRSVLGAICSHQPSSIIFSESEPEQVHTVQKELGSSRVSTCKTLNLLAELGTTMKAALMIDRHRFELIHQLGTTGILIFALAIKSILASRLQATFGKLFVLGA